MSSKNMSSMIRDSKKVKALFKSLFESCSGLARSIFIAAVLKIGTEAAHQAQGKQHKSLNKPKSNLLHPLIQFLLVATDPVFQFTIPWKLIPKYLLVFPKSITVYFKLSCHYVEEITLHFNVL